MRTVGLVLATVALLALGTGCGRPFDVKTAPGLVELEHQEPDYQYRAISPEGVVMGVRVVDVDKQGDLEFWTRATTLRIRELDGYALLGAADVKSRDGTPGHELRFGHDEHGKPYLYTLRIFVGGGRLFFVETGGPKKEVEHYQGQLDWMQASLKLR
ncbi:MAG TPA: serine/threonine protein kinase [Polyangiaceae bacterium]